MDHRRSGDESCMDDMDITTSFDGEDFLKMSPQHTLLETVIEGENNILVREQGCAKVNRELNGASTLQGRPEDDLFNAEALEALLKFSNSNNNATVNKTDFGKDSLFIKFDPLFSKSSNCDDTSLKMNKLGNSVTTVASEIKCEFTSMDDQFNSDANLKPLESKSQNVSEDKLTSIKCKPMQVVSPSNSQHTSPSRKYTHTQSQPAKLVRSMSAMSPRSDEIAFKRHSPLVLIDDHNMSRKYMPPSMDHFQYLKDIIEQQESEMTKLKEMQIECDKAYRILDDKYKHLEKEHQSVLLNEEKLVFELKNEKELQKQINARLMKKESALHQMNATMEECMDTMSRRVSEHHAQQKGWEEREARLQKELQQLQGFLANNEEAFNAVHSKYERCKATILLMKEEEKALVAAKKQSDAAINKMQNLYDTLKQDASDKLSETNKELQMQRSSYDLKIAKLNSALKKLELDNQELRENLAQKTKHNEELTQICDELINREI